MIILGNRAGGYVPSSSFGIDTNNPEDLYNLTQQYGGSIAVSGQDIYEPKGILNTIGEKSKEALGVIGDVLTLGNYAVASVIDTKHSFSEVFDKKETISDAIFGEAPKHYDTYAEAIAGRGLRLAADVLLDPTTYLTLGVGDLFRGGTMVSRDLIEQSLRKEAISALPEDVVNGYRTSIAADANILDKESALNAALGNHVADQVDTKLNDLAQTYSVSNPTDKEWQVVLGKEGNQKVTDYAAFMRDGRQEMFLTNETKRILAENPGMTEDAARASVENDLANGSLRFVDELQQQRNWNAYKLIREEEGKILERDVLYGELDTVAAKKTVTSLMQTHPQLWETLIDKGGIKFFGKTILESQRINKVLGLLPGFNKIGELTAPVRQAIVGGYKRYFSGGVALSKEGREIPVFGRDLIYDDIQQHYSGMTAVARKNNFEQMGTVAKRLNLSAEDWKTLQAAIEYRKLPSQTNNPMLTELWKLQNGFDHDRSIIPENVTNGLNFMQRFYGKDIRLARAAGYPVVDQENYAFHFVNSSNPKLVNRGGMLNAKHSQKEFAGWADFENLQTGESVIRTPEYLKLQPFYKDVEEKVINESYDRTIAGLELKKSDIEDQLSSAVSDIQSKIAAQGEEQFMKFLDSTIDTNNGYAVRAAIKVFKENFPMVDVQKLVDARKAALDGASTELGGILRTAPEEIQRKIDALISKTNTITDTVPGAAGQINEAISREQLAAGHILKNDKALTELESGFTGKSTPEVSKFFSQARKVQEDYAKHLFENSIDKDKFNDFINTIANHAMENPGGVRRLLDSVIGKQQKLSELFDRLNVLKVNKINELDKLGNLPNASLWKNKSEEVFRRYRAPVIEANKNGASFEENGLSAMVAASDKTIRSTMSSYFLQDVAKNVGFLKSEAPAGYRAVSVSRLKNEAVGLSHFLLDRSGEELVFHPDIADAIEKTLLGATQDKDIKDMLAGFDKLTAMFKASSTALLFPFHTTNLYGNVLNSFLDIGRSVLDPIKNTRAIQLQKAAIQIDKLKTRVLAGERDAEQELTRLLSRPFHKDATGHTWTNGEMIQVMKQYNIAFGSQFTGAIGLETSSLKDAIMSIEENVVKNNDRTLRQKAVKTAINAVERPMTGAQNLGQMIENHSRIVHFLSNLEKSGDIGSAANRTKMFLFDYSNLSSFEKKIVRRFVPFYTWTKKNIELQINAMMHTPGKISTEYKAVKSLADTNSSDGQLTQQEYNNLPSWMKSSFYSVKSRRGGIVYVRRGISTPLEGFANTFDLSRDLAMVNPLIRLPAELITGYDTFRGGMIDPHSNAKLLENAPQFIKDSVGYYKYPYYTKDGKQHFGYTANNPKMFHAIMNFPIGGRLFNEYLNNTQLEKQYSKGQISLPELLRQFFTSSQLMELDMNSLAKQKQQQKVQQLQQLLKDNGIGYSPRSFQLSKN